MSPSTVRLLMEHQDADSARKWRRPRGLRLSERLTDPQRNAGHSPLQNVTGLAQPRQDSVAGAARRYYPPPLALQPSNRRERSGHERGESGSGLV